MLHAACPRRVRGLRADGPQARVDQAGAVDRATLHRWKGLDGPFTSPALRSVLQLAGPAPSQRRPRKSPQCRDSRCPRSAACHLASDRPVEARKVEILVVAFASGAVGARSREDEPPVLSIPLTWIRPLCPASPFGLAAPRRLWWTTKASCHGWTRSEGLVDARKEGRLSERSGAAWSRVGGGYASVPALIRLAAGQLLQRRPSSAPESGEAWSLALRTPHASDGGEGERRVAGRQLWRRCVNLSFTPFLLPNSKNRLN